MRIFKYLWFRFLFFIRVKKIDEKRIPYGIYCYIGTGRMKPYMNGEIPEIKYCPYYNGGFLCDEICKLSTIYGTFAENVRPEDSCKCCGINDFDDEEWELYKDRVEEQQKIYREEIDARISISK